MGATMDISSYLNADKGKETVTLHANAEHLLFLGTNVEASAEPGYNGKAPITFVPLLKKVIGVIAVSSYFSGRYYPFFVKIGWKDERPHIFAQDSDKPWIPQADKLAQITNKGKSLSVKIDDAWYTTNSCVIDQHILPISSGNLICRYLVSESEESQKLAKKIKQEAEKMKVVRKEELSAKDMLVELKARIAEQEANLKKKSTELHKCRTTIKMAKDILEQATFKSSNAVKAL